MGARKEDAVTVILIGAELKMPIMDWSVEDVHKEFTVFKTLAKMWLGTKGFQITNSIFLSCN